MTKLSLFNLRWTCLFILSIFVLVWLSGQIMTSRPYVTNINSANRIEPFDDQQFTKRDGHCATQKHIVYIKVPKTGSTNVALIILQFGQHRNLTFALPRSGVHFGLEPLTDHVLHPLQKNDISPIPDGQLYDLLVHHCTFNKDTVSEVFPNDTMIVASVREPFSHWISSYFYYNYSRYVSKKLRKSTNETLKLYSLINKNYDRLVGKSRNSKTEGNQVGKSRNGNTEGNQMFNRLSQRLGIPFSKSLNETFVQNYIKNVLDRDIDLVLLQEYFDESLILMKRLFCWEMSDIIYTSRKVRTSRKPRNLYSPIIVKKHKSLAVAEYMIYDHFYEKFWKTVWKEGSNFFSEVLHFKSLLRTITTFCEGRPLQGGILDIPESRWNKRFSVLGRRCATLTSDMWSLTEYLRNKQSEYLRASQV